MLYPTGALLCNTNCFRPSNPLRMLGEFLIQKSDEIEGGAACKKEPPE